MPTAYKVLAQTGSSGSSGNGSATLAATTNTNLYTVPSATSTVVSTITVCNQVITVYASAATMSFSAFGSEIS